MNFIAFLIVGLIAGWIASQIMEGHGFGTVGDIIVGIVGAFLGGILFNSFGVVTYGFWGAVGTSVVGAIVFLFLVGLFPRAQGPTKPLGRL